ncbi:hypothetical protein GCM10027614_51590 [Micromonospora vulcania]
MATIAAIHRSPLTHHRALWITRGPVDDAPIPTPTCYPPARPPAPPGPARPAPRSPRALTSPVPLSPSLPLPPCPVDLGQIVVD